MLHHAKNAGPGRDERLRRSSLHQILGHAPRHGHQVVGLVDDVFGTTVQGKGAHMVGAPRVSSAEPAGAAS